MALGRTLFVLSSGLFLSACAYPQINQQRQADIRQFRDVVECEFYSVKDLFPAEVNPKVDNKWDIAATLDLTLVSRLDADGKVSWAIPVNYSAMPTIGGSFQETITAHVSFSIDLAKIARQKDLLQCSGIDPSATGLGLASWIRSTFGAIEAGIYGGSTYTKIFEVRANAGARLGYVFAPVVVDAGPSFQGTSSQQISVAITPSAPSGPQQVVIVGDLTKKGLVSGTGSGRATKQTSAGRTFSNPNLIFQLNRQTPLRLLPGQMLLR